MGGIAFIGQIIEGLDPKDLRGLVDDNKQRLGSGIAAVIAVTDGRASIAAGVSADLVERFNAVDLVRAGVEALGGKGVAAVRIWRKVAARMVRRLRPRSMRCAR